MWKQSLSPNMPRPYSKVTGFSLGLLLCTACGGGSGSSSPSTPPAAVNQAPIVSTKAVTVVTEGQPFVLDASGSRDTEGAALTYNWRQVSGPTLQIDSPEQSKLTLTAPNLDDDQALSFEVSVSDGVNTSTSTVSLDVEDLKTFIVESESSEYGTGGPTNPSETVPDPSIYEGNKPLDRIIGLTSEADGGYRVHWTASNGGRDMPVSSQAFSMDGEKTGPQSDGVFLGGDQVSEDPDETYKFIYGITFATVKSGDTVFNLNGKLEFSGGITLGYTSHRGLLDGEVEGFGDTLIEQAPISQKTMGGAFTPIGSDSVVLTLSERTTDAHDDPEAIVNMTGYVVDRSGQVLAHNLGSYPSNATANGGNRMTATSYDGGAYLTAWSQNTEESGYDIRMQRATEGGILIGGQETVNTEDGHQLTPRSVTLSGGNMVVAWLNHVDATETEPGGREIRARLVQPNGSFASEALSLGPVLPAISDEVTGNHSFYHLTALNSDQVLLSWQHQETVDEGGAASSELRALVLDSELNVVSNEFSLAMGDTAENISNFLAVTLPDNRVVLGWHNNYPYAEREERPDTSHTVSFYPVGKE